MPAKRPQSTPAQPIRWTLARAEIEFGLDPRTTAKRLAAASIAHGDDGMYSTREICAAVFGDYEGERVRKTRAEADLAELERDEKRRRLIPADAVSRVWDGINIGVREAISRLKISEAEKVAVLNELRGINLDEYFAAPAADAEDDQ